MSALNDGKCDDLPPIEMQSEYRGIVRYRKVCCLVGVILFS